MEKIAPMRDESIYLMTGSQLGYDGPGSGMYKLLCKIPVPRKVHLST